MRGLSAAQRSSSTAELTTRMSAWYHLLASFYIRCVLLVHCLFTVHFLCTVFVCSIQLGQTPLSKLYPAAMRKMCFLTLALVFAFVSVDGLPSTVQWLNVTSTSNSTATNVCDLMWYYCPKDPGCRKIHLDPSSMTYLSVDAPSCTPVDRPTLPWIYTACLFWAHLLSHLVSCLTCSSIPSLPPLIVAVFQSI